MQCKPELIVMLTHDDVTVKNASDIFDNCKDSKAKYWGFKEEGIPHNEMCELFSKIKECGKTTVLEVVAYDENECLKGAQLAHNCRCDILMGTKYYDSVNKFCMEHSIRYMPFVGDIHDRPSVLEGSVSEIIDEAKALIDKGVYGIDLLAYRYTGDCTKLIDEFTTEISAPVCIAGSIDCLDKLNIVKNSTAWSFTIGGAFFEHKFGEDIEEQINNVCNYIDEI